MNDSIKRNIILFFSVTFVVGAIYLYKTSLSYEKSMESFKEFKNRSSELIRLQKKWGNHNTDKRKLLQITRQIKPTKQIKSKGSQKLTYENLSKPSLERLGRLLLNSQLNIKELKIEKVNKKVLLHVEVVL
ncbi:hypothetical protein [Sulfurospirillum arcachonense]|uniref:hypothetical protein n=1 Tax=Sulfurospirillum arcachonense TaxID=57666 RepID=UPI0004689EB6|nr:hypothetical protein [Sulfurospirillum arcachonense]